MRYNDKLLDFIAYNKNDYLLNTLTNGLKSHIVIYSIFKPLIKMLNFYNIGLLKLL